MEYANGVFDVLSPVILGWYMDSRWYTDILQGCFTGREVVLGLYLLSGKTSYRKISWSLEAARFGFILFQLLWNLTGTLAEALPVHKIWR